jgi:hypothetical protein
MTVNRLELVGLSVLVLIVTTTVSPGTEHGRFVAERKYHQSGAERAKYALIRTV